MFGSKKRKLGIQPKQRTLDQINQDYNHHAAQAGHKQRIINEIQAEIEQHLFQLAKINDEAKLLPKPSPAQPPAEPSPDPAPAAGTLTQDEEHA